MSCSAERSFIASQSMPPMKEFSPFPPLQIKLENCHDPCLFRAALTAIAAPAISIFSRRRKDEDSAMSISKSVILIGLDPGVVEYSKWPGLTPEKLRGATEADKERLAEIGC